MSRSVLSSSQSEPPYDLIFTVTLWSPSGVVRRPTYPDVDLLSQTGRSSSTSVSHPTFSVSYAFPFPLFPWFLLGLWNYFPVRFLQSVHLTLLCSPLLFVHSSWSTPGTRLYKTKKEKKTVIFNMGQTGLVRLTLVFMVPSYSHCYSPSTPHPLHPVPVGDPSRLKGLPPSVLVLRCTLETRHKRNYEGVDWRGVCILWKHTQLLMSRMLCTF